MNDLFDQPRYPESPGYQKGSGTSFSAAQVAALRMSERHQRILDVMTDTKIPLTFYQIADLLHEDSRNIQPRLTELELAGKIKKGPRQKKSADSKITLTGWILT